MVRHYIKIDVTINRVKKITWNWQIIAMRRNDYEGSCLDVTKVVTQSGQTNGDDNLVINVSWKHIESNEYSHKSIRIST